MNATEHMVPLSNMEDATQQSCKWHAVVSEPFAFSSLDSGSEAARVCQLRAKLQFVLSTVP